MSISMLLRTSARRPRRRARSRIGISASARRASSSSRRPKKADARHAMFNADGSEAEMCGNGRPLRGQVRLRYGIARSHLTIETGAAFLTLRRRGPRRKVEQVCVDMGAPILESSKIPTTLPGNPPIDVALPGFDSRRPAVDGQSPLRHLPSMPQRPARARRRPQDRGCGPCSRQTNSSSSKSTAPTISPCASGSAAPAKPWRAAQARRPSA